MGQLQVVTSGLMTREVTEKSQMPPQMCLHYVFSNICKWWQVAGDNERSEYGFSNATNVSPEKVLAV